MHKTHIYTIFLTCFYFNAFADKGPHFSSIVQSIFIEENGKGFRSDVSCRGFTKSESSDFSINYTELHRIEKLEVYYENEQGKKIIKLDKNMITEISVITNNFFTGEKAFHFELPKTRYFEYSYKEYSSDLMLLTSLPFRPERYVDTVIYNITVPENYVLIYKPFELDSEMTFITDSTISRGKTEYHFTGINHYRDTYKNYRHSLFVDEDRTMPSIKLIAVPVQFKLHPEAVLNEWYLQLIESLPMLNEYTIEEVKKYIGNVTDSDFIAKKIFQFVQSRIKYLDIENGMQAFKPHNANDTYLNKEGDCKDMAFLLFRILRYYNFKAHLALVGSITHCYDMDFPSISCANHVICVIEKEGDKYIYLDATEDACEYGFPSAQIQGRHMFVIEKECFNYIPPVAARENKTLFSMKLNLKNQLITGTYHYDFKHSSSLFYRTFSTHLKKSEFDHRILAIFSDLSPSLKYGTVSVLSTDSSFSLSGDVSLMDSAIVIYGDKKYFSLSFLPYLDLIPKSMNRDEKVITYCALNKNSEVTISFPDSINLLNERSEEFSEDGFQFNFKVRKSSAHEITISSSFIYDDVIIKNQQATAYNKVITKIKYELNKGILYQ